MSKDNILFTPGPLTTSASVKQAMLRDLGSRDQVFIDIVQSVRNDLLAIANLSPEQYTTILFPGSGTTALEAVLSSMIDGNEKCLILVNGAYGQRLANILARHQINHEVLLFDENKSINVSSVEQCLKNDASITHVAMVHCETSTGMLNDINAIGQLLAQNNKIFVVDAMSSFGAVPIDFLSANIHFMISSANKCLESVPGLAFVIAQQDSLVACKNTAKTLTMDLFAQWNYMEKTGQFRFTPPVQVILALQQALYELHQEGGVDARAKRYQDNKQVLLEGMQDLPFKQYLPEDLQSYIITSFLYPENRNFDFDEFYGQLQQQCCTIYPGKVTQQDCFRIGTIGHIDRSDICQLLSAIRSVYV